MMKISSAKISDTISKLILNAVLIGLLFIFSGCSDNSNRIVDSFGSEEFSAPKTTDTDSLERNDYRQPFIIIHYMVNGEISGQYAVLSVGAQVMDQYAVPMQNTEVIFSLDIENDVPFYIKKIANTGQIGWAETKLLYPPSRALDTIRIIGTVGNISDTSAPFPLPIIQPTLSMTADPEILRVNRPGMCDTSTITFQLTDWMGNPIDNGQVVFSALVAGELCGPSIQYTNVNGIAETKYRIWYEEIPDGQTDPQSITVGVRASLFGYPDMEEEISIWCYRP